MLRVVIVMVQSHVILGGLGVHRCGWEIMYRGIVNDDFIDHGGVWFWFQFVVVRMSMVIVGQCVCRLFSLFWWWRWDHRADILLSVPVLPRWLVAIVLVYFSSCFKCCPAGFVVLRLCWCVCSLLVISIVMGCVFIGHCNLVSAGFRCEC